MEDNTSNTANFIFLSDPFNNSSMITLNHHLNQSAYQKMSHVQLDHPLAFFSSSRPSILTPRNQCDRPFQLHFSVTFTSLSILPIPISLCVFYQA